MYKIQELDILHIKASYTLDSFESQSRRLISNIIMYSNIYSSFNVGLTGELYDLLIMNNQFMYSNIDDESKLFKVGLIMHLNIYLINELKENNAVFFDNENEVYNAIIRSIRTKKLKRILY